jgi:hypothetical protein
MGFSSEQDDLRTAWILFMKYILSILYKFNDINLLTMGLLVAVSRCTVVQARKDSISCCNIPTRMPKIWLQKWDPEMELYPSSTNNDIYEHYNFTYR